MFIFLFLIVSVSCGDTQQSPANAEICGEGEVFSNDCIGAGCFRTQCYQEENFTSCIEVPESACVRGCVCADGKLRTQNGTCVLPEHCPPKSEEYCRYPYSKTGCGNNCHRKCRRSTGLCSRSCFYRSCDCIPPFVYDEDSDQCVPKELCPAKN